MSPLKNYSIFPSVIITLCGSLAVIQSNSCHGAGYGINENSASYMGTGFAGRSSNAIDASILASNPSGMGFMTERSISAGSAVIFKGGKFDGTFSDSPLGQPISGSTNDFQANTFVPFGHIVVPIEEHINLGFSGYAPFGVELDYDKNWVGRFFGLKTSVKVINLQASISYRILDTLSVGVGIIGSYVQGELTQKTFVPQISGSFPAKVNGDDKTLSWNAGLLWNVDDRTSVGFAYHDSLKFTLEGESKVEGIGKHDAKLDITMPERAAFSLTHHFDSQWTFMAEATWSRWSRFDKFHVKAGPKFSSYVPMNWKDVWAFSGGVSYRVNSEWLVRAGYMRDNSPVDDKNRTVRSPDADRSWYTCGINWKPAADLSVDVSYAYVDMGKNKITEQKHSAVSPHGALSPYGTLTGEYDNQSHVIAAQLNYTF